MHLEKRFHHYELWKETEKIRLQSFFRLPTLSFIFALPSAFDEAILVTMRVTRILMRSFVAKYRWYKEGKGDYEAVLKIHHLTF